MAGGPPGSSSRGRGGKFRKFTRGGGKHFSRDLRPVDADGNEVSMWSEEAQLKRVDDEDESGSEEESEEESEDEAGPSNAQKANPAEMSREERKREKQARKAAAIAKAKQRAVQPGDLPPSDSEEEEEDDDDDDDMPANPNHSRQARNQTRAAPGVDEAADGVAKMSIGPSRREREALEAQQAKDRYRKLHEAGKTDEAKADLARLKLIREKREAEAARKKAEREEKEAEIKAKRAEIEAREAKRREAALGIKKGSKKK
ncbi:hypothetical protein VTK26DRAFT_5365 [Humicola hyalothermophila]